MHCFGGKLEQAKICAEQGWLISISAQKNKEKKKIIKQLSLENLVIESDAPYIAKKSSDTLLAAQMIADYMETEVDEVLYQTMQNMGKTFGI